MSEPLPPNAHVSSHPCLQAKLSQLRSQSTSAKDTKTLIHEIAVIVGCEALAHGLSTKETGTDTSALGYEYTTQTISPSHISLVPILRSGLGMVDALESLLPNPVPVHHLGLYREKATLQPVEYYNNLPYHRPSTTKPGPSELAIVIDPVIATGQTMCAAIDTLQEWGVKRIIAIGVLASEGGLRKAATRWSEGVEVWVGGCDAETDGKGFIKPGLGDVGDRLFSTIGK
ncbi:putative uracil phosphoribosyltransferase urg2 [Eremomyces bilateralis CBS 781.70]|uniref:uracil phosphoribosyltransferase n=1 Tax=Eremomyces bilateralis CBS 781.70 TaxID=1392243 RepID=A0A6G1GCR4_9PEZI|nr:putative uracil phosphoribosyltransferase urg2 [Eremomyces bilateralis CBS 781.70]KAF1815690.1 putative uracil phosphoribosyltransferase urg2 [Eremomyces bilateralis CBS 781.70]